MYLEQPKPGFDINILNAERTRASTRPTIFDYNHIRTRKSCSRATRVLLQLPTSLALPSIISPISYANGTRPHERC